MWQQLSSIWQACIEEAWYACCEGTVPIGAVIAGPEGDLLVRSHNRIHTPASLPGQIAGNPLAHAEINALIALDYQAVDPHACSLYTTCEPCPLCMGAFYMSGLRTLHFASRDTFAGSINLLGKTAYMARKPIRVFGPLELLEPLLLALHVHYELETGHRAAQVLFDSWGQVIPGGVHLGKYIYMHGVVIRMRQRKASAQEAIDCLEEIYQNLEE